MSSPPASSARQRAAAHQSKLADLRKTVERDLVVDSDSSSQVSEDSDHIRVSNRSRIAHTNRPSLFSSEVSKNSYRGFVNLGILTLVLSNLREVLYNLQKYGVLIDLRPLFAQFLGDPEKWPMTSLCLALGIFVVFAFFLEKVAARLSSAWMIELASQKEKEKEHILHPACPWWEYCIATAYVALLAVLLVLPPVVVYHARPNPASALIAMLLYTVAFLKLVSFASVNHSERYTQHTQIVRRKRRDSERKRQDLKEEWQRREQALLPDHLRTTSVTYPHNLSLGSVIYFMLAPTLCYELNFPRSPRIRKGWILRRSGELVVVVLLVIVLIEQYILPLMQNAVAPMQKGHTVHLTERLLKLSIPNLMVWLLLFYALFHLWLNILGEVLRFGDRLFYLDWWNSTTIDYFWRTWNIPVHRWMLRHLYNPLTTAGWSRSHAAIAVFVVSAIFHEYIVAVSFQSFKLLAFTGMISQVPLALLTRSATKGKQFGNIVFWVSIMLGQPLMVLIYYFDYKSRVQQAAA